MTTTEHPPALHAISAAPPFAIIAADFIRTGGMDRANFALASYLATQRHPLQLVAHRADDELARRPGVTFHRVAKPLDSYLLSAPLINRTGRRVAQRVAAAGGRVLVNGGNCGFADINWVHYVHAAYTPASVHNPARRFKTAMAHRRFLADEARILKMARLIIANSDRTRRDLIERLGLEPERIHIIYYGIDPQAFCPASEEERAARRQALHWPAQRPVVMFIGALGDRRKGFDTLFATWQKLCGMGSWDADLVVIGIGGELAAWKQRAVDSKMDSRIRFLGFRKDVPDLLRAADVLVAPTRYEAYGLGVHEAICCGLPALVSADAGVAERYSRQLQSLLLPDCQDTGDLIARLLAWRQDIERLRAAARALGDQLRRHTWDCMARQIVELASPS